MPQPFVTIPLQWTVGHSPSADLAPTKTVPATVPGAVQLDWAKAEGWPPHYVGDNFKAYAWMEDVYWTYTAPLSLQNRPEGSRLIFACGGIDYAFEILVAGQSLLKQEGMFTPIELDLTDHAKDGDVLEVRVSPVPKSVTSPVDRVQANRSCKPAVSYEWDFHPRLVPLGIWQEAELKWIDKNAISSTQLKFEVADSLINATITLRIRSIDNASSILRWQIFDPAGKLASQLEKPIGDHIDAFSDEISDPIFWWPHDHGHPARYESVLQRLDDSGTVIEEHRQKFGLRRVKLVMHEKAWEWPQEFPKSRSNPPITLEINGRRIFAKGANWVSPDIFPGTLSRETYEPQLTLVKQNHMNILRMWGGAPVQKEAFYDLCDELGIMVWQEFPLACNNYADDPTYLKVLDQESQSIIRRLRQHASVVLWCGGNELFNAWSGMTDQAHALRLLNANCYKLDRNTPFLPTSPVMGMGHGHYTFRNPFDGRETWAKFQESACTAYTEFGMPGIAGEKTLRLFMPEADLFPPKPGGPWTTHHAFGAWQPSSWLSIETIEDYFGPIASLARLVELSQLMQSQGYKGLFEEARRQKPKSAMALNWCLNEPWPTAANNSLISWPCEPKPALFAVGQSLRPVLASAKIAKFRWQSGEWFDPELWLLSDAPAETPGVKVTVSIENGGKMTRLLEWTSETLPPNRNQRGPRVGFALPSLVGDRFTLSLEVDGRPEWNSSYVLCCYSMKTAKVQAATRTMNL